MGSGTKNLVVLVYVNICSLSLRGSVGRHNTAEIRWGVGDRKYCGNKMHLGIKYGRWSQQQPLPGETPGATEATVHYTALV